MDRNQFLPFIRRFLGGLSTKPRVTSPFKKLNFELLEGRYTPAYPGSGALGPNFTMGDNGNVRTFTLNNNFTTNGWTQVDISYSNNTNQLVIDGNNRTVIINDTNFAGLFFAGNTFVGTDKPTILKNFNFQSSVDITGALSKITGSVQLQNCRLELYANINNNGGGLVYNDGSGSSGLNVLVTNASARVFGKVGSNAGPLIGYISSNSGNIYNIENCSTVVSDSNSSTGGNSLGSGAGAFVGSGISNTVSITNSYVLFNGSMGSGSGIIAGKFLGSSGSLAISKFYAVTNITYAPFSSTDASLNAYGLTSYFGGSAANTFNLADVNFMNYGNGLQYIYGTGPGSTSLVTSLTGFGSYSNYTAFSAVANTPGARIGNQPYFIYVNSGSSTSADTFYTYSTSLTDWSLNLASDTLIAVPQVVIVSPDNGSYTGGNNISIYGENFIGATSVLFGTTPAISFTVNSSNFITAVAPPGLPATVDVRVTTAGGTSANTSNDNYNYVANTTTSLVSSANPSVSGQAVTFTATVTAVAGTATGSVDFYNGAALMGSANLTAGVATFVTSSLSLGAGQNITAVYAGNVNFNGSTSSAVSQTVIQAGTVSTLLAAPNPSVFGQSVTFTATVAAVAPGSGTPTGTVTFYDGATLLGTGSLSSGTATYNTASLAVGGSHSITVVYSGNSSFLGSTSSATTQVVNRASTTTTLIAAPNPSVFGQSVTFTATVAAVAPGSGTPTGTATFYDGATLLGTGSLSSGTASLSTNSLAVGNSHSITVVYAGDNNFLTSTSSAMTQTVNLPPTITSANNTTFVLGLVSNSFQVTATGFPANLAYTISAGTLPNGVILNSSTGLISGAPLGGTVGVYPVTIRVTNGVTTPATQAFTLTVVPAPVPLITGSAPAQSDPNNPGSAVSLYDPNTNQPSGSVVPFPRFMGQIRVAAGDFNMDGRSEIVAAAGPGGGPAICILDSQTGQSRGAFFAYDASFTGGVFVAVKDFNNDGIADIITGAGLGGGPHVKVFNGINFQEIRSFFAYESSFTGGVSVGSADINGDNIQDIVTGAGIGGGPLVKVFDGATSSVISQWFAYSTQFTGGVFVAMGDIGNDGNFEVVTGAGIGGGPLVAVWNPLTGALQSQFFAYSPFFTGGVRVGVSDATGDGINDLVTGAGPGGGPQVNAYNYPNLDLLFSFFSGPETNTQGVFVS